MRLLRRVLVLTTIGLLATSAVAHDFWVQPDGFAPDVGEAVDVQLMVGDHYEGKAYPRNPRHIRRFVVAGPNATRVIDGSTGADTAGRFRATEEGVHVIGYRSRRTRIELDAETFEDYLEHEGLHAIVAERRRRGETAAPGREVFSRCAKSVLRTAGTHGTRGHDRVLGFAAEIVPVTAPWSVRPGGSMDFRVLADGRPLAGLRVRAHGRPGGHGDVQGVTDAEGRVRLTFPRAGTWLVAGVVMRRADAALPADWESLWASLTFRIDAERPDR